MSTTEIQFESANPVNYHAAMNRHADNPRVTITGKLLLPQRSGRVPCVIVTPGSLGVAPSHLAHAATFAGLGFAAFVIDPFTARSVTSTVANQAQFSFAASAYDVLAAAHAISGHARIDATRIGAQGHSRGGSAVLTAATVVFARAALPDAPPLHAVYAAYPWSGQQFLSPSIGETVVRAVIGDRDEWCSPQQVQGHIQAMRVAGGNASVRIVGGAQHSFDRDTPIEVIADASVSPAAPTVYMDDAGALIHPLGNEADPKLVDRDVMVYALKAGYGRKGARIGSQPGEAAIFRDDMIAFWQREFG